MKKILCFILFAFITWSASSQIRIEAGTSIGGYKVASSNYSARAGITAGAFYDVGFKNSPNEFLAIGLQYTENGYTCQGLDGKTTWIQLPVESHTKFMVNDKFSLFFDAGLFFGYALTRSANVYWKYGDTPVVTDISGSVKRFNLGTTAAIGMGLGRFSIRVNWQRGLLNLMGPTPDNVYRTNSYNTNSWRIVLAFSI